MSQGEGCQVRGAGSGWSSTACGGREGPWLIADPTNRSTVVVLCDVHAEAVGQVNARLMGTSPEEAAVRITEDQATVHGVMSR